MSFLSDLAPPLQALLAGLFTWGLTAAGAALVFLQRRPSRMLLDVMLGKAADAVLYTMEHGITKAGNIFNAVQDH